MPHGSEDYDSCSTEELLLQQLAASRKVLATWHVLRDRLGALGIHVSESDLGATRLRGADDVQATNQAAGTHAATRQRTGSWNSTLPADLVARKKIFCALEAERERRRELSEARLENLSESPKYDRKAKRERRRDKSMGVPLLDSDESRSAPLPEPSKLEHQEKREPRREQGLYVPLLAPAKEEQQVRQPSVSVRGTPRPSPSALSTPRYPTVPQWLFPSAEDVKKRMLKPQYCVENLYREDGVGQAIARDNNFQNFTLAVIFANTIWIGIVTDHNKADVLSDAPSWIQCWENIFCLFFSFEIAVRYDAFASKRDAFQDAWFFFDSSLVALMVYETWLEPIIYVFMGSGGGNGLGSASAMRILRLLRLSRLTRVARIARLLRQVPELAILTRALFLATRSVGATLSLLVVAMYIFAIFFTQMLAGTSAAEGHFETVPGSMHTLLVQGVLPDRGEVIDLMLNAGIIYYVVILVYMMLVALTIADMLVGVIVQVIESCADAYKEDLIKEKLSDALEDIVSSLDTNSNGKISTEEFGKLLDNDVAVDLLDEIEVDVIALVENADMIFDGETELSFEDFIEIVLGFRQNDHGVKDQFVMRRFVREELVNFEKRLRPRDAALPRMTLEGTS